jgi:subtilisin family serine protease
MQWNHDNNGHGTHVAGIILDVVDSGSSSSSGNNVDLFVVSAFDDDNVGYESDVVRAIRTCVEQGKADVVNL